MGVSRKVQAQAELGRWHGYAVFFRFRNYQCAPIAANECSHHMFQLKYSLSLSQLIQVTSSQIYRSLEKKISDLTQQ